MVKALTTEARVVSRHSHKFGMFYTAVMFLSLHLAVVLYINSSFLEQFISGSQVSLLYVLSAIFTIVLFLSMSKILSRTGKHALVLFLATIEFCTLVCLGFLQDPRLIITFFVIHQTIVPLIFFNLDIYMEELIGRNESHTGTRRGLLLAITNTGIAVSALTVGYLIGDGNPNYHIAYYGSALLILPFILIMTTQFKDATDEIKLTLRSHILVKSWKMKDLRNVFFAHLLLQIFFVLMVIYSPIYLTSVIGLSWTEVGQVLFVGIMAYAIFEYPLGVLIDKYLSEREIMAFGFLVIAVVTSWFVFITSSSVVSWMLVMFLSRWGASMVEVSTESYFFKHTKKSDVDMIGFFRASQPLSYVLGAGIGTIILYFYNFDVLFLVLAFCMIPGFFSAMALKKVHTT